jgi:hypothetical protein
MTILACAPGGKKWVGRIAELSSRPAGVGLHRFRSTCRLAVPDRLSRSMGGAKATSSPEAH